MKTVSAPPIAENSSIAVAEYVELDADSKQVIDDWLVESGIGLDSCVHIARPPDTNHVTVLLQRIPPAPCVSLCDDRIDGKHNKKPHVEVKRHTYNIEG